EGAVHGIPASEVHFHEVGATDAIIDIVGTCLGLDWLDIQEFYFSAMPTGGGTVKAAHGKLAVPTPAVMRLWETHRVPVYSNGIDRELCTPTGTAIACTLAAGFGSPPSMQIQAIGLGAGSRMLAIPNILRLWIGEKEEGRGKKEEGRGKKEEGIGDKEVFNQFPMPNSIETITVLETQIDDLSPQAIGYVFDALFAAGALDVFTAPIVMKKSRLGVLLTAICHPEFQDACEAVIFRETTTLGIRRSTQQRTILHREIQTVQTEYGEVKIKVAKSGETIVNVQPEYEDCAEIARIKNISWREVHRLALQSWYDPT
ncbi:nickel pincer cofactor biosynthesis protein LarC, partial [Microcoleus sp. FACHB-DQ6]|nr:nickel pincer cofactor biosynthesis protein LarC [Microcoleus sp. FACHB-DQ6]